MTLGEDLLDLVFQLDCQPLHSLLQEFLCGLWASSISGELVTNAGSQASL